MGQKRIPENIFKLPLYWSMKAREIVLYTAIVNYEPGTITMLQEITGMNKKTAQAGIRNLVKLGLVTSYRDYTTQEMGVTMAEGEGPTDFILIDKWAFNLFSSKNLTPDAFKLLLFLKYRAGGSGRMRTTKSGLAVGCGITTDAAERYVRDLAKKSLLRYKYLNDKLNISIDF